MSILTELEDHIWYAEEEVERGWFCGMDHSP